MATCDPSIEICPPAIGFRLDPARQALVPIGRFPAPVASSVSTTAVDVANGGAKSEGIGTGTVVLALTAIAAAGGVAYFLIRRR